jgi:6-phosphofructokinase
VFSYETRGGVTVNVADVLADTTGVEHVMVYDERADVACVHVILGAGV